MSFAGRCSQGIPEIPSRNDDPMMSNPGGNFADSPGQWFNENPLLQSWNASAQDALAGTLPGQTSHLHTPRSSLGSVPRTSDMTQAQGELLIEYPQAVFREKIVEVPTICTQELVSERVVEVPEVRYVEKIVEVPEVHTQEIVRTVPKIEVQEVVKTVPKVAL
eukprot:g13705.t1